MKFAIFVVAATTLVAPVFGAAAKAKRAQPVSVYGQCGGVNYCQ
jgi:hypothetical protein